MEIAGAVRKRKSGLSNEAVDFDQTFADNDACHAHPLFDMINRNSVQVEHPAASNRKNLMGRKLDMDLSVRCAMFRNNG